MDESIFKTLYEEAKINKLTEEEMKAYKHSILEYDDVFLAIDYAEEKGIAIGEKRGIAIGEELNTEKFAHNCYNQNMSVKQIASLTGLASE
jgi:CRISPR/Cas system CMR-associated protein Cmr3 (group 5 of RAMP superfamily)